MTITKTEVMTPDSPRWEEFTKRLAGPEGCDFKREDPEDSSSLQWWCKGGNDKSKAIKILQDMGGVDIGHSLVYFEEHGGFCDCEILFNVDQP